MNKYFLPVARKRNLVVQELPDELLVYDLDKNKAICLNQTAKLILEQCDGTTSLEEAKNNINQKLKAKIDNEIFWVGLEQLKKNRLLDESQPIPEIPKVSRRDLMRSGLAVSIALPLITSLIAPSAINAQSVAVCTPSGGACFTDLNGMDNCCIDNSCTMSVNGVCCIIGNNQTQLCDPNNDFCCPGTACDGNTGVCVTLIP